MLEAILGVAGTIVAAVIGGFVVIRTRGPRFVKPELVDVAFAPSSVADTAATDEVEVRGETPGHGYCVLDVKLRNPGEQPVFVVRAALEILNARVVPRWKVPDIAHYITATEMVSANYDVRLPIPGRQFNPSVRHDLSQVVPPTGVDRFQIRLGLAGYEKRYREAGVHFNVLYRLVLRLSYGGGHADLVSRPIVVGVPLPPHVASAEEVRARLTRYAEQIAEFNRLPYLQKLDRVPTKWGDNYQAWAPRESLAMYFEREEYRLRSLIEFGQLPGVRDPALEHALETASTLLQELPRLRAEFLPRFGRETR
ncbi:hypothetical protein FHU38_004635 [Saccharomonospora amisosensis]|uniref:Uncharacterized protein n=1 Tax=Saccharomonospora amisosensis TaxID=1128677 RepID=A0A7X5ZT62_9PSEU|nr:hypothetical protein [Saccharomonospora amisosensis]NIJ14291.1 hypothetical protein [Saccharomonospora amisosensis]